MTTPRLPVELCSQVILDLRDEPKGLKRCSLIARAWRYQAQRLLFHHHFVRIGVAADAQYFPLDKKGDRRKPSDFAARARASDVMRREIRGIRFNMVDLHRIMSNGRDGDAGWTVQNLFAEVSNANLAALETLVFFTMKKQHNQLVHSFPIFVYPFELGSGFQHVVRVHLQASFSFPNFTTLQHFLCQLPRLEEFSCPTITWDSRDLSINPPLSVSLRQLVLDGCALSCDEIVPFSFWLVETRTKHSLTPLTL
jgi:hypothetical protein